MKLTPWINGSIKPVRAGVYQRKYDNENAYYCKFDGSNWYCVSVSIERSSEELDISPDQNLPWRGLAEQPK